MACSPRNANSSTTTTVFSPNSMNIRYPISRKPSAKFRITALMILSSVILCSFFVTVIAFISMPTGDSNAISVSDPHNEQNSPLLVKESNSETLRRAESSIESDNNIDISDTNNEPKEPPPSIPEQHPPALYPPPPQKGRCALLFFGLPKLLNVIVLASIRSYILLTNPGCDIYAHTYKIYSIEGNARNNEPPVKMFPEDIYFLTNNVTMHTKKKFKEMRNLTYYRQYFPHTKKSWSYPQSLDNMIMQWHSIDSVWKFMEASIKRKGMDPSQYYERVGLFRSDIRYENPINMWEYGDAVVPDFGLVNETREFNDRLFYGTYANAKIWANRFDPVESYVKTGMGKRIGLHSETYLTHVMKDVDVVRAPICAQRVRVTGEIKHDCWCNATSPRLKVCPWWLEYLEKNNFMILDSWK